MKRLLTAAVFAAIIAALSPSLFAQWPFHPQPGVPKGPDGKPNLNAPAPRTAIATTKARAAEPLNQPKPW